MNEQQKKTPLSLCASFFFFALRDSGKKAVSMLLYNKSVQQWNSRAYTLSFIVLQVF